MLGPWDVAWFVRGPSRARTSCGTTPTSRRAVVFFSTVSDPEVGRLSRTSDKIGVIAGCTNPDVEIDPRLGGAAVNLLTRRRLEKRDQPGFACASASVSEELGGELIGASLYEFEPGEQLWPYHFHRGNEEWLVVVAGDADRCERRTESASCVPATSSRSAGRDRRAHAATTAATSSARVAIFSTLGAGSCPSTRTATRSPSPAASSARADAVDYWDGEEARA